jgi:hypothetical protein
MREHARTVTWKTAMPSFRLVGLPADPFRPLFALSADALERIGAVRVTADRTPGYPCRIGLRDAEPGEELLLLPFEHQPAHSPYRASGPIYVGVGARPRALAVGEVPEVVRRRQISVRAYDAGHRIVGAEVCAGDDVAAEIERQFGDPRVAYLHLHHAKRGCYACRVERVADTGDV